MLSTHSTRQRAVLRRAPASLFDSPAAWDSDPMEAIRAWLASDRYVESALGEASVHRLNMPGSLSAASQRVYAAMLGKFVGHLDRNGVTVVTASKRDIASFLEELEAKSSIRMRYARLIERLYYFLKARELVNESPATGVVVEHLSKEGGCGEDKAMVALTKPQQAMVERIVAGMARQGGKMKRTALMIAVLLGAGPTVTELLAMQANDIIRIGKEPFARMRARASSERLVPIAKPWAQLILRMTKNSAVEVGVYGAPRLLFPGIRGRSINIATANRAIDAALKPLNLSKACARTLRNTFALCAIEQFGEDQAQTWLGNKTARSMKRYRAAMDQR